MCRHTLFNVAKEIASRVVMFLPRNVNFNQLAELSLSASPPWSLEVISTFCLFDMLHFGNSINKNPLNILEQK